LDGNDYDSCTLEARAEISDSLHRYCRAADRRDWSLFAEVFHDDGSMMLLGNSVPWRLFVEQARAVLEPLGPTLHRLTNIVIEFAGNTAYCESYITAYHLVLPGEGGAPLFPRGAEKYGVVIGGRYLDRFEHREDKWRIASRTPAFEWRAVDHSMQPIGG
jgi:hypothetical protein